MTAAACLAAFLEVQRERAGAYRRFDEVFKSYLATAAEDPYRSLMTSTTAEFQALSQRVLALEARLRGPLAAAPAADALRAVQGLERQKLQITLSLHALRSSLAHQRFSWQHEGHAGTGCSCAAAADEAGEPTQAEVEGACRESYQQLEACVRHINDALDEVRELRQELLAEAAG
jgi:hypothetical protein